MSVCIAVGGKVLTLAAAAFTLSWTHSVEKTRWEEDWLVTAGNLSLVEARVKGSGAGMEPGEGAVLRDGWWVYTPNVPARPSLTLAASGATGGGWTMCGGGSCIEIGAETGVGATIYPCPKAPQSPPGERITP